MKSISILFLLFGLCVFSVCGYADDLESAAYNGNKEAVIRILKTKPDINHRDSFGGTALHGAMFQKDISIVDILLDYGFDPNAKGIKNGYTPLHDAVWANNIDAAKLLLDRGSNPGIRNKDGLTAYGLAIKEGKSEIAQCIKSISEKKGLKYK